MKPSWSFEKINKNIKYLAILTKGEKKDKTQNYQTHELKR